ncbi:MAG: penicillin-binding protein, partial [Candidatus Sericytochromatia bacterium]
NCQNKPDKTKESTVKDIEGNVSEYAVNFSRLTTVYKKKTADDIEAFFNERFDSKNFSGSFLVAKNGEILFENYGGYANKENLYSIKEYQI